MEVSPSNLPFFVSIDCQAHSRHRDPSGVYKVEVVPEESLLHNACAAIQIVKDSVAFLDENIDKVIVRVYDVDGSEIHVPMQVDSKHCEMGTFCGRAKDYADTINLQ